MVRVNENYNAPEFKVKIRLISMRIEKRERCLWKASVKDNDVTISFECIGEDNHWVLIEENSID